MAQNKTIGIIGLGDMGGNIAQSLHNKGYSLFVYDRNSEKYNAFNHLNNVQFFNSIDDLSSKINELETRIIWMMLPAGAVTNSIVESLSKILRKETILIDGSNSVYDESKKNGTLMKTKGLFYLDVGCAGGPSDLKNGVALMVGGDKIAFEMAKDVFATVSGNGTYGYVGPSGAGHATKLVHNIVFYSIFPAYAEGVALLNSLKNESEIDMNEALRLLSKSPPITVGIMDAIVELFKNNKLPENAPEIKISEMVKSGSKKAELLGFKMGVTNAILSAYNSMPDMAKRIYIGAKKIITGH